MLKGNLRNENWDRIVSRFREYCLVNTDRGNLIALAYFYVLLCLRISSYVFIVLSKVVPLQFGTLIASRSNNSCLRCALYMS